MDKSKKILVCPLDWGLGHASRCVPLVSGLLGRGKEVLIASGGQAQLLLKKEFPDLTHIDFPSYTMKYSKGESQIIPILKSIPKIINSTVKEHFAIKKIIKEYDIDTLVSDGRLGLWNKQIKTFYITHQLMIKMPARIKFLETIVWLLHRFFIKKYHVCLIPDTFEGGGYAGDLTHLYNLPPNARFIGPLSRFSDVEANEDFKEKYYIVAVLSGVEPQRSILENILIEFLKEKPFKSLIIRGVLEEKNYQQDMRKNVTILPYLDTKSLKSAIENSSLVICRSGYSSIMDLLTLNKEALLIPTPGQTEQEYLAEYLVKEKNFFQSVSQKELKAYLSKL